MSSGDRVTVDLQQLAAAMAAWHAEFGQLSEARRNELLATSGQMDSGRYGAAAAPQLFAHLQRFGGKL